MKGIYIATFILIVIAGSVNGFFRNLINAKTKKDYIVIMFYLPIQIAIIYGGIYLILTNI